MKQREEIAAKINEVSPSLRAKYGSVVTDDRVMQALQKYPTLEPEAAFNAMFAPDIARHIAQLAQQRGAQPGQPMLGQEALTNGAVPNQLGAPHETDAGDVLRTLVFGSLR
jgi:hypothetical protein